MSRASSGLLAAGLLLALGAPLGAQEPAAPGSEAGGEAASAETAPPAGGGRDGLLLDPDEAPLPARWGRGPLEVRDPYLLALNRLSPWARSPQVLSHLQLEMSLRGLWSNSYAFARNRYLIDGEVREVAGVLRLGLFDRFEVGLFLPVQHRTGPTLDGFIEAFHRTFSLPDMDRDRSPEDRYEITGVEPGRGRFHLDQKGSGFSDLIGEARVLLTPGGPILPAATAGLRLRLPTGRRRFDLSDGVDVSFSLDASQRIGGLRSPFVAYAGGAWTIYGRTELGEIRQARHRGMFYVGGEVELTSWASLVVHAWIESKRETRLWRHLNVPPTDPLFNTDLSTGNYLTYIAAGFRIEPVQGLIFDIGMLENLVDPETTADFTVLCNLTWRL